MSTISQALQKRKFSQAGGLPPVIQQPNNALHWKIAASAALFIIIVLLSALIYLLLNPRGKAQADSVPTTLEQPVVNNHLVKVSFETKPLPDFVPKVKKVAPVKVLSKPQQLIKTTPSSDQKIEKKVSVEEVTTDLQKRFELALLLTEIEHNENPTDEFTEEEGITDGSDIREMSSAFQYKVPLIRYDSHMYSSVVNDRWIRINGEMLKEGEFDSTGQLELLEIQPQRSIFRLERQSFSVESLTDWEGY
jgi:general secretion pathway protein B